jgi:hypothetical protein
MQRSERYSGVALWRRFPYWVRKLLDLGFNTVVD